MARLGGPEGVKPLDDLVGRRLQIGVETCGYFSRDRTGRAQQRIELLAKRHPESRRLIVLLSAGGAMRPGDRSLV
ncbi:MULTISPECIES: hypothetical protein [unclassified Beijerinckia]|uniref:hypothetical protein n=1 Tax=unclassified Beijerinckia TaxID=2638183 RepID=UPI000B87DAF7|nr:MULTISPECIES: hypothetical protein [unclassified Beijerinckia]MDH7799168.1 hypothetical protein [Beijerinckia sp. GAS462]